MTNPFDRPKPRPPLTPREEYAMQQQSRPAPDAPHLNARERAALQAYREKLARARRPLDTQDLTRTWMP